MKTLHPIHWFSRAHWSALLFLILATSTPVLAQKYCGFDAIRETHRQLHGLDDEIMNERLLERILDYQNQRGGDIFTIPTVVHIIHQNGEENISDEQVESGIDALNEAFLNSGDYFDQLGTDIGVQFCLAKTDPDGNLTNGITHTQDALTDMFVPGDDAALKDVIRWDTELYFNMWVVASITQEDDNEGVVGYATFPDAHGSEVDGVVIEAQFFGSNLDNNKVIMHEVGHYLGLYHTFQDACPNQDCLTEGDRVCDTPPDSHVFNTICFDGTNSCQTDDDDLSDNNPFRPIENGGLGDQEDMQTNYMDYSALYCFIRFTEGQKDRMLAGLIDFRFSLLEGDRCNPPCANPINVNAFADNLEIDINGSVSFANSSTGFTEAEWHIDGVFETNETNPVITFNEAGIFLVELLMENGDPGCEEVVQFEVVVNCPITSEFEASSLNVPNGGTISFDNQSDNATSYEWYIDDVFFSDEENPSLVFDENGAFSIYLVTSNGQCEVQSAVINVVVGNCTTGNEANVWYFQNNTGAFYGFDFNGGSMTTINENLIPTGTHSKSSICDADGNLLFISTGEEVYGADFQILENGDNLTGHESSHYGTLFVKKPGSAHEYYLFYNGADANDFAQGLSYCIIDASANDGLGAVTDVKNFFIEDLGSEPITAVRHCNLRDFWLVFYDTPEQAYKSYLVTPDGLAETPVVTEIEHPDDVSTISPIRVNAQGDKIAHKSLLMSFNTASGELDLINEFVFDELIGYDWSPNGKYVYYSTGSFENTMFQVNTELDPEDMLEEAFEWDFGSISNFKFFVHRAPDGKVYMEEALQGKITVFHTPNLFGAAADVEDDILQANTLLNSFGNYYHAYLDGQDIFLDGPTEVCLGETVSYSLQGAQCQLDIAEWEVQGADEWIDDGEGNLTVTFNDTSPVSLLVTLETECGIQNEVFTIDVIETPEIDLGPDMPVCIGIPLTLNAGSGFDGYSWSTEESTSSISVTAPGPYSVVATIGECSVTDEILITGEIPGTIDLGPDFDVCDGDVVVLDIGEDWIDPVWQNGIEGPTFTVYEGGAYSVSVTLPCAATDEVIVDDCDQTIESVEENSLASAWSIFPNPNEGQFDVLIQSSLIGQAALVVTDSRGRLVVDQNMNLTQQEYRQSIDLSVEQGMYFVTLVLNGEVSSKKLIVLN